MENEIRAYFDRDPIRASDQPHRDGEWSVIRIEEIREWPDPRWSVIVSEIVHNLRASLDNLVWQLVLLEGKKKPGEHNQFPIYSVSSPKPGTLDNMLRGVKASHRAFIEEIEPYLGPHGPHRNTRLALHHLVWLSNRDKHRFLHPLFGIRERGAKVVALSDQPGGPIEVQTTCGTLYVGAELVRFRASDTPHAQVYVEGNTPLNVAFGNVDLTLSVLANIAGPVIEIVERFGARFLVEQAWRAEALGRPIARTGNVSPMILASFVKPS